jgi:hypothetical protein
MYSDFRSSLGSRTLKGSNSSNHLARWRKTGAEEPRHGRQRIIGSTLGSILCWAVFYVILYGGHGHHPHDGHDYRWLENATGNAERRNRTLFDLTVGSAYPPGNLFEKTAHTGSDICKPQGNFNYAVGSAYPPGLDFEHNFSANVVNYTMPLSHFNQRRPRRRGE